MSIGAISTETNTLTPTPTPEHQTSRHLSVVGEMEADISTNNKQPKTIDFAEVRLELSKANSAGKLGGLTVLETVLVNLEEVTKKPDVDLVDPSINPKKEVKVPSLGSRTYQAQLDKRQVQIDKAIADKLEYEAAVVDQTKHDGEIRDYTDALRVYEDAYTIRKKGSNDRKDLEKIGLLYEMTDFAESNVIISTLTTMLRDPEHFAKYRSEIMEADRIARIKILRDQIDLEYADRLNEEFDQRS